MSKKQKKEHWTSAEQQQAIGSAMAIATTANLLSGLRRTELGKQYIDFMIEQEGFDEVLCDEGTQYTLLSMLPFAVELCLKALKAQNGNGFIRTHNLKCLWEDLNKEERVEVRKRVKDPAWRQKEKPQQEACGITGTARTVDEVIEAHRNNFEDWRYVPDGVKNLTEEKKAIRIDEAFTDLFGIVNACVEYHQSRDKQQQ